VKPLSEEELAEGWIEHITKVAPVFGGSSTIDVKFSNGEIVKDMIADNWSWDKSSAYGWVVAWRPHDPKRDQGEALKAAIHAGVDKLGGQDKAMGDDKPAKDHRVMEFYKVQTETMTQVYLGDDRVCTLKGNVVTMAKHCPVMMVGDMNRLANFLRKMI